MENEEFEKGEKRDYRKELWIGVAVAYAGATGATSVHSMSAWANAALHAYDERFGKDK